MVAKGLNPLLADDPGLGKRLQVCLHGGVQCFFFTLVTGPRRALSLKLSDARVYEPEIRTRLVND